MSFTDTNCLLHTSHICFPLHIVNTQQYVSSVNTT